jgi:hypothetical protein
MKKFIFIVLSLTVVTLSSSSAAIYKGQNVFSKHCLVCHTNGQATVSSKTKSEWSALLADDGSELSKIHFTNKKAQSSWKYFYSASYKKRVKHLKDFLIEYAKDSGNIPACN